MIRQLLSPRYKLNLIHKVTYSTSNKQVKFGNASKRLFKILLPEKGTIARKFTDILILKIVKSSAKECSFAMSIKFVTGVKLKLKLYIKISKMKPISFTVATGCLFVSSGITMAVPFSLGKILDLIFEKEEQENSRQKLRKLCSVLGVVFVVGGLANFARVYLFNTSSLRIVNKLRRDLYKKIVSQELGWFETRGTGELVHRLANDTHLVGNSLSQNLSDGLRSTIMLSIGTGMMVS